MDDLEENLRRLLRGESIPMSHVDVRVIDAESFVPLTKLSIGYIVCGVLINDKNEVLMMQEAKRSCYGDWYLPAGRLEPGENLVDGVKREVKEETGLECEPTTLISVECSSGVWHRFTFTGRVTGGNLKSTKEKDSESLQGRWMSMDTIKSSETQLRSFDILKLIKCTQKYYAAVEAARHPAMLPALRDHCILVLRLVIVFKLDDRKEQLLINTKNGAHFPSGMIAPRDRAVSACCKRVVKSAFGKAQEVPKVCGLLSVEHCGIPKGEHDGVCYTMVYMYEGLGSDQTPQIKNPSYEWRSLHDDSLHTELLTRIQQELLVPLIDLH
ncbi:8-oxo-dGDP phosphatase NUDT18-like [Haliotis rufescens]|uniref:8-oxo-dGDP phosphatase NUDT18-like n=1 Tax=Haliotis rufescens TaxID=6454 RepID=UPI00201E9256|nr:8-oxo-dGDP phosphatase NUDT18-like [Haliotis rufescens]